MNNKIKKGVEYFPGDSGGYYIVYDEKFGEQVETIVDYPTMEIIKEWIKENKQL